MSSAAEPGGGSSPGPVDWELAARIAARFAARHPQPPPYDAAALERELTEHTALAEDLVAEHTGLRSLQGPARARVADRSAWALTNIASFQRLLRPLTDRFGEQLAKGRSTRPLSLARRLTGAEVGALLGWMSSRVLGQYDLLVVDDEAPEEQDLVWYVGPNVAAIEHRYGFPAQEFRLWLALHEVTHRAQFTGVEWLREHYLSLVGQTLAEVDPDPQRFMATLRSAIAALRAGERPLEDGGLMAVLATPRQRELLKQVGGLMSLLEGHGDVTMTRAGGALVPSAPRFARVLNERRRSTSGPARVLQRLIGLEAKLNQYEQGERFIAAIEAAGGPRVIDRCWQSPAALPTLDEIRDPARWLARTAPGAGDGPPAEGPAGGRQPFVAASGDRAGGVAGSSDDHGR